MPSTTKLETVDEEPDDSESWARADNYPKKKIEADTQPLLHDTNKATTASPQFNCARGNEVLDISYEGLPHDRNFPATPTLNLEPNAGVGPKRGNRWRAFPLGTTELRAKQAKARDISHGSFNLLYASEDSAGTLDNREPRKGASAYSKARIFETRAREHEVPGSLSLDQRQDADSKRPRTATVDVAENNSK
jgi:hypothetical protein